MGIRGGKGGESSEFLYRGAKNIANDTILLNCSPFDIKIEKTSGCCYNHKVDYLRGHHLWLFSLIFHTLLSPRLFEVQTICDITTN